MAISTREFLVFVAIVTSAIVLEVRQHGTDENLAAVHTQSTHEGLCNPEASALKNGPRTRVANRRTTCKAPVPSRERGFNCGCKGGCNSRRSAAHTE